MKKITTILLIATLVVFVGLSILPEKSFAKTAKDKSSVDLNIITSNKAQYEMVKQIVSDKHNVQYLFQNEKELKAYNKSDKSKIHFSNADLFFYVGKNYEPWLEEVLKDINKSKTGVIDVSRGIRDIDYKLNDKSVNPYYWTGLQEYYIQLFNIKSAIEEKDPQNRDYYEKKYQQAIKEIKKQIQNIIASKSNKDYTFIAIDDNLDYFYNDLNIDVKKCDRDKLNEYISNNHLDDTKIIILKDSETEFTKENYKVISLQKNNDNISNEQMILNNYQAVYNINK